MKKNTTLGEKTTKDHPNKYLLLTKRTSLFIIIAGLLCMVAAPGYSQSAKVTINKRNATIKEVLNKLKTD